MNPNSGKTMDAVDNVTRWQRWVATGSANVISQLLNALDAKLPAGWKRLNDNDLLPFHRFVRQGSAWYSIDETPSHPKVTLSLERPKESELRGGLVPFPVGVAAPSAATAAMAWDLVTQFLEEGVVPAAQAVGADIRTPTAEEAFLADLFLDVRDRLRRFSKAARKVLPLTREEAELWREFVISAFREKAIIDARLFRNWLVVDGWSPEAAAELDTHFVDHCLLLTQYRDEVSAA
jgi:hypothetical protein